MGPTENKTQGNPGFTRQSRRPALLSLHFSGKFSIGKLLVEYQPKPTGQHEQQRQPTDNAIVPQVSFGARLLGKCIISSRWNISINEEGTTQLTQHDADHIATKQPFRFVWKTNRTAFSLHNSVYILGGYRFTYKPIFFRVFPGSIFNWNIL